MTEVAVTGWQKPPDRNANKKPSSDKEDIMRRNTIKLRRSKEIDTRSCTNAQKEKKNGDNLLLLFTISVSRFSWGLALLLILVGSPASRAGKVQHSWLNMSAFYILVGGHFVWCCTAVVVNNQLRKRVNLSEGHLCAVTVAAWEG